MGDTEGHNGTLSGQQIEAATRVFEGRSLRDVAEEMGVGKTTMARWAKLPAWESFVHELEAAAHESGIKSAVRRLDKAADEAAKVLVELLDDEKGELRHKAATSILDRRGLGPHSFEHSDDGKTTAAELEEAILKRAEEIRGRRGTGQ